ncbi:MAG: metal-dependent transcriptional regulator [Oscillospiraceae bacterium]
MSRLLESGENYLETILILREKGIAVRSVDIANELGFSKPSVSRAVKNLKDGGFITVNENGYIFLTEKGEENARIIYERHQIISAWLIEIGVDVKTALEDACRIEHDISAVTFEKLKKYISSSKNPD